MAKMGIHAIRQRALEILEENPGGVHFIDLVRSVASEAGETPYNTIYTQVAELPRVLPEKIYKPSRGLFAIRTEQIPIIQKSGIAEPLPNTREMLIALGFVPVGAWALLSDSPACTIQNHPDRSPVVYAFLVEDFVMYVGKSNRSLRDRIGNLVHPEPSQRANQRSLLQIKQALAEGKRVTVYALVDWEPVTHRGLALDLPTALESTLVDRMCPPWNDRS